MQDPFHYRMWLFALALVVLQFLLSDEGRRVLSTGLWQTSLTVCSIGCILLAWPYVRENTLKVWHGDAYLWPVAILVVSAFAVVAITWLATYSHMASHPGEQSDSVDASRLQEELESEKTKASGLAKTNTALEDRIQSLEAECMAAHQLAEDRLATLLGLQQSLTEQQDKHRMTTESLRKQITNLSSERDTLKEKVEEQAAGLLEQEAKQARFDRMYSAMEDHYKGAPTRENYTLREGQIWSRNANQMLRDYGFPHQLHPSYRYEEYSNFKDALELFRKIMGQVSVDNLR